MAAATCDIFCSFLETEVTWTFIKSSRLESARSEDFCCDLAGNAKSVQTATESAAWNRPVERPLTRPAKKSNIFPPADLVSALPVEGVRYRPDPARTAGPLACRPDRRPFGDSQSWLGRYCPAPRISDGCLICFSQGGKGDQSAFGFLQKHEVAVGSAAIHRNHVSQTHLLGRKQIRNWINEPALDG